MSKDLKTLEKDAKSVSKQALDALQQSRAECKYNNIYLFYCKIVIQLVFLLGQVKTELLHLVRGLELKVQVLLLVIEITQNHQMKY